ncbi:MAG: hypothetical protein NTU83_05800, partial [Candidatus Hydrogenedentes bacterium]|nr:hypothetical protein [Candidatus Hydrogenedentota bacterium]
GYRANGLFYFDFETNEAKAIRFFVLPEECVMLVHRPWPPDFAPYTEWLVHLVDAYAQDEERRVWQVVDREIDIIVEHDLQTYRLIDLNDYGEAIADGRLSLDDARRLLIALQAFLDKYLHGGGLFPPAEINRCPVEDPQPQLKDIEKNCSRTSF